MVLAREGDYLHLADMFGSDLFGRRIRCDRISMKINKGVCSKRYSVISLARHLLQHIFLSYFMVLEKIGVDYGPHARIRSFSLTSKKKLLLRCYYGSQKVLEGQFSENYENTTHSLSFYSHSNTKSLRYMSRDHFLKTLLSS